jgi:hypothetical protein
MEWYDDEPMVHAYTFRSVCQMVVVEKDANPKRPLCIGALLNDHHIRLKKPVTYVRSSAYAFGLSTFTKRQGHMLSPLLGADGPAL